jgi:hypothetical protein
MSRLAALQFWKEMPPAGLTPEEERRWLIEFAVWSLLAYFALGVIHAEVGVATQVEVDLGGGWGYIDHTYLGNVLLVGLTAAGQWILILPFVFGLSSAFDRWRADRAAARQESV